MVLLVGTTFPSGSGDTYAQSLHQAVRGSVPGVDQAIVLSQVANGAEIFRLGGDQLMNPASVLKVITTAAALDRFGPYFQPL